MEHNIRWFPSLFYLLYICAVPHSFDPFSAHLRTDSFGKSLGFLSNQSIAFCIKEYKKMEDNLPNMHWEGTLGTLLRDGRVTREERQRDAALRHSVKHRQRAIHWKTAKVRERWERRYHNKGEGIPVRLMRVQCRDSTTECFVNAINTSGCRTKIIAFFNLYI